MNAWLDYLSNIAMGVVALLWLFEGSRRLDLYGVARNTFLMLAGGVFLSIVVGGMAYFKHRIAADVLTTVNRPVFAKQLPLPDNWGGDCCKGTREAESRKLVQAAFVESGRLYE